MADESKLREQVARGEEAARLLENPVLKAAFEEAEKRIVNTWIESDVHDESGQRMCKLSLRAQQNLRQAFVGYIADGQMATHQLTQSNDPTKPKRRSENG